MISRRSLLTSGTAALAGAGVATGIAVGAGATQDQEPPATPSPRGESVAAYGETQAGVARPSVPQQHCLVTVLNLAGAPDIAALGEQIIALTSGRLPDVLPDGPGDLTVTVGVGIDLPAFRGDDPAIPTGGDLLLLVAASDMSLLDPTTRDLVSRLSGSTVVWSQRGQRGLRDDGLSRNPLGYLDGIIVPRSSTELDANVWREDGSTICVVRRLRLDLDRFLGASVEEQDAVIGRRKTDGAPLSGGTTMSQVDLEVKTPDGTYLTPARSHVRAAHPSFTGSGLMLRRGYPYDNGRGDQGLIFICHQSELDTFVRTQLRLEENDDLMPYVTATASSAFEILPGFSADRPLGG